MGIARIVAATLFALAVAPALGQAQGYDPAVTWKTIDSPYVRVTYPDGMYVTAVQVARSARVALDELTVRLGWRPARPIDIVLADETDLANGSARSYPYNLITLNAVAPEEISELSSYDNWVFGLVAHELTHVVNLDTVSGLPAMVDAVFGRWLFPNALQPQWLTEGLAVYFESALSHAGRVRSSYYDMLLRDAVLAGHPMQLDDVGGAPRTWPQGTAAYLYGGYFVDYLARRFGEAVLRDVSLDYSGRLIPYAVNLSIARAVGVSYPQLYRDFLDELGARFASQVRRIEALGRREGHKLTDRGQDVGPARVAADGTIYFIDAPIDGHAALLALGRDGRERHVARVHSGATLALVPGRAAAIVAEVDYSGWYRTYGDLFAVDLQSGSVTRLTTGLRAASPDVSPDGRQLVFAKSDGLHSFIAIAPLATPSETRLLADLGAGAQAYAPRFSHDGLRVAFSGFVDGQRDVFVVDVARGEVRRLTDDRWLDGSPVFAPDDRGVIFHSDHDGIFDLFYVTADGRGLPEPLTRVQGGALRPELTADATALVYQSYGPRGFDLSLLPLAQAVTRLPVSVGAEGVSVEAEAGVAAHAAAGAAASPIDAPEEPDTTGVEDAPDEASAAPSGQLAASAGPRPSDRADIDVYPVQPYRAWRSLWPRGWLPVVGYDGTSYNFGAMLAGEDAVGLHQYALSGSYTPSEHLSVFDFAYVNRQFHPGLYLGLSRYPSSSLAPYVRNGVASSASEMVWDAELGTSWPLWRSRDSSLSLSTSYLVERRTLREPLLFRPLDATPVLPDEGRFHSVRALLSFSNVESYIASISPERGVSANTTVRVEGPWLGSQYSSLSATVSGAAYLPMPWLARHVLATSVFLGAGTSSYRRHQLFSVSGAWFGDPLLDIILGRVSATPALRGFPATARSGNALVSGTCEYRFPILDVEGGISTLPIYARTLHAAAFVDGASIVDEPSRLGAEPHLSAGGELRLSALLGYYLPVTFRLGYGHGLFADRVHSFYVLLGTTY